MEFLSCVCCSSGFELLQGRGRTSSGHSANVHRIDASLLSSWSGAVVFCFCLPTRWKPMSRALGFLSSLKWHLQSAREWLWKLPVKARLGTSARASELCLDISREDKHWASEGTTLSAFLTLQSQLDTCTFHLNSLPHIRDLQSRLTGCPSSDL